MPGRHPEISVLLFDVGGVLVEITGMDEILQWLEPGVTEEEIWRRWLTSPTVRAFETGHLDVAAFATAVVAEMRLNVAPDAFLDSFRAWVVGPLPGAREILDRIPPRYRRALLSNSNGVHWPRIERDMGFGAVIDQHFVSHLTGRIKPDAEAFRHVIETLECAPGEIAFFDDNLINVEAARTLGITAVVTRGAGDLHRALDEIGVFTPG